MKTKDKAHKYNTRSKKNKDDKHYTYIRNESSDDSDSDSEEEELNMQDYQKMLSRVFPSKYMQSKTGSQKTSKYDDPVETIKTLQMIRKFYKRENNNYMVKDCDLAIEEMKNKIKSSKSDKSDTKKKNKKINKSKKNNKNKYQDSDSSSDSDDYPDEEDNNSLTDSDEDSYDSENDEMEYILDNGAGSKFNIIFTMGQ